MTIAVIINSTTVKPAIAQEILALVRHHVPAAQVHQTGNSSEFRRFATGAATRGLRRVVVAGGDGSLHLAVNSLAGLGIEIGLVPVGEENDFARTIGMPADLESAVEVAVGGVTVAVDVGLIQCRDHGFRAVKYRFMSIATTHPREIPKHINSQRLSIGQMLSNQAGRLLGRRKQNSPRVRLWIDGRDAGAVSTASLIVANGQFSGGGLRPLPQARLNDGLFDVVRVREGGHGGPFGLHVTAGGIPLDHPLVDHWRAHRVEATGVGGQSVSIEADGELLGWLPASFEIEPSSLTVVVPETTLPKKTHSA